MELSDDLEKKLCYERFLNVTSNEALALSVCVSVAEKNFRHKAAIDLYWTFLISDRFSLL